MTPEMLKESAMTLLALDANGVLVPHGIGALAREAIEKLLEAIAAAERRAGEAEDAAAEMQVLSLAWMKRANLLAAGKEPGPMPSIVEATKLIAERDTLRARVAELEKTVSLLRSASRGAAKIVDAAMKKDQTNAE
jgi:hypothetical protein